MKFRLVAPAIALALLAAGCSAGEEVPAPRVSTSAAASPSPTAERTAAAEDAAQKAADDAAKARAEEVEAAKKRAAMDALDLTPDQVLCALDEELTGRELDDAMAPLLGFAADRDLRTPAQDDEIRDYKNAAFMRACPERAS